MKKETKRDKNQKQDFHQILWFSHMVIVPL